jgi:hypothetical protein
MKKNSSDYVAFDVVTTTFGLSSLSQVGFCCGRWEAGRRGRREAGESGKFT